MTNSHIILIKYKYDIIALIIRLWTHSNFNHCAWILNDYLILESSRKGIIISSINKYNSWLYETYSFEIPNLTIEQKHTINSYLLNQIKSLNYFKRLLSFLKVPFKKYNVTTPTCSGLIALACSQVQILFSFNKHPLLVTPEDIYKFSQPLNLK